MANLFKVGDVVQLKSGGPSMTISTIINGEEKTSYWCQWFKGASAERANFPEEGLKPYEAPKND